MWQLTINKKILLTFSIGVLLLISFIIGIVLYSVNKSLKKNILDNANFFSEKQADNIKADLFNALSSATSAAGIFQGLVTQGTADRVFVKTVLREVLKSNKEYSAAWAVFGKDMLDGEDVKHKDEKGSTAEGIFAPFWFKKDNGEMEIQTAAAIDNAELGQYVLTPMNNGEKMLSGPYFYPTEKGQRTVMRFSVPIFVGQKVIGVVGVDYDLSQHQTDTKELKIYGSGTVTLLSQKGIILAHKKSELIGKRVENVDAKAMQAVDDGQSYREENFKTGQLSVFIPMLFNGVKQYVFIEVVIPMEEALADLYSTRRTIIILGLAGTLALLLLSGFIVHRLVSKISLELLLLNREISGDIDDITGANKHLAQATEDQAASLEESASTMEEITSTIKQTTDNVRQVEIISAQMVQMSGDGIAAAKEMVAKAIHLEGKRKDAPFVAINCGAIPFELLESELFGHIKGSFTDAKSDHLGKFDLAKNGTLLLDEISELHPLLQVKLLRVLQEREFTPVGGTTSKKVNARILCATNKNLRDMVERREFREDLYFRINVFKLKIPPLSERREDIPLLVAHFIKKYNLRTGKELTGTDDEVMKIFMKYSFSGNVRELENAIEHAFILCNKGLIRTEHLPSELLQISTASKYNRTTSIKSTLYDNEKDIIKNLLLEHNGIKSKVAETLGIHPVTLWRKIKKFDLN